MSKHNIMNTYGRFDVTFEKGIGSKVYDTDGKEYIDFVSGVAVNCLGHSHPAMVAALEAQSKTLIHVSNLYWNKQQLDLAKKLAQNSDHEQVFFCNSGTEAVETGLKLARKYGRIKNNSKNEIIYMKNAFHGRTLGALAVTGQEKYQKDFMPLMEGVKSIEFDDIAALEKNINENTCAVIVEPIQGEGGIIKATKAFLQEARGLCDKFDALLIFDEVQCGIGRVGTLFAYQSFGVIPDIICMAKGLGGGFPIGATLANEKSASAFVPGDHGCTFGGSPLACAVSLAVLEELVDNGIIHGVNEKSKYFVEKLKILQNKYPVIESIQGMGLILGIKVNIDPKMIVGKCFEKGLLLVGAGKDVVRILPPLNVKNEEIDQCITILQDALKEV
ncbi:aspartate aminotransferase family protein [Marinisporobacter balticus]|uniref:Acetylornithine aminotransferase n=1 Tax=Marinisporobacter balticus TaxID=2018667 RepID=A0A4R2KFE3_9FIRM|nr:aspartate aminotransferase family protein [Marinisporobacter balticus]TCO71062.1 acetylornithine aminotransferase [Marinisporobacter balticus]